eukprot:754399-Pyramimonas_sp.AAC.1
MRSSGHGHVLVLCHVPFRHGGVIGVQSFPPYTGVMGDASKAEGQNLYRVWLDSPKTPLVVSSSDRPDEPGEIQDGKGRG